MTAPGTEPHAWHGSPMRSDIESPSTAAPLHLALVLLLFAAYVAGYAWSAPHTDTADELMRAYEIRHWLRFPLEGPPLGQVLHLGPVWFYLVSIPLWVRDSWLAGALFVGAVCGLKFPLAYWCGTRLLDRNFGLLWAAALFVPGWASLEQLVFLNPNAVATAVLLVLALSIRAWDRPALASFFALGLALALAAHIHPTAAPVALLAVPIFVRYRRNGGSLSLAAAVFACAFALLFVPYVVSQAMQGFPDLQSASGYVEQQVALGNVLNASSILWNYVVAGPAVIAEYLMGWTRASANALGLGTALAYGAAIALALIAGQPRARRLALETLAALIVFAAWAGILRPTTPFQFTWVLGPVFGALLALGLWALWQRRALRAPVAIAVAAFVLADAATMRAIALQVRDGEGRLPSRIMDIKGRLPAAEYRDVWFPARAHAPLGALLCHAPKPANLHGHLAYVVDKDLGLDMLFACRRRDGISLAGSQGGSQFVGMTRPFWRALGAKPDCWIGSLGISLRAFVPGAQPAIAIASGATYLPRRPSGAPVRTLTYSFPATRDSAVLVTNLLGGYEYFRIVSAQLGDEAPRPVASNDLSALYAAPKGSGVDATWSLRVEASNPDGIDVVEIPLLPSPAAASACAELRR